MANLLSASPGIARRPWAAAMLAPLMIPAGIFLSTAAMTDAAAPPPDVNAAYKAYTASLNTAAPATATNAREDFANFAKKKIPAFARKYDLPCSACHTTWPELNPFGQAFKDRGYQLGNDKDSPIWQNPSYFPLSLRTTPQYHIETTTNQPVDATPGDELSCCVSKTITQQGFDLSGIDFLMLGTLYKNITFGLVPTLDPDGTAGIETAFVRFDNIGSNGWFNVKMGKFELDNLLSEKRIETLSNNGSFYVQYHFVPIGDSNPFGMGDNQLGIELMGHNANSWTRYTFALVSDADGTPGLPPGTGKGLDAVFTLSQAWQSPSLGPQRVGIFGVLGQYPTLSQTSGGEVVGGTGSMNKSFYRIGATAQLWAGQFEFLPQIQHASDNAYLGLGLAGTDPLPSGAKNAEWNGALLEVHYVPDAQFIVIGRYEQVHMAQQSDPDVPKNYGNTEAFVIGLRSYPFMFSRAGLAMHIEYSLTKTVGGIPLSGDGVGAPPLNPTAVVNSSSILLALDFAF